MWHRNQRIFWAINHKTLMPAEVGILQELGYQVFVPKVITESLFRSSAVSHDYDASLTLPNRILTELNEFDFYNSEWTPRITEIVNRYFGAMFGVAQLKMSFEAVRKFDGPVFLRAYGLADWPNYHHLFQHFYGDRMHDLICLRPDIYFAAGYQELGEVEPDYLAKRMVHLPIAAPRQLWQHAGSHTGEGGYVLFLCSNRLSHEHHAEQFAQFRAAVQELPHVVVDAVDEAHGDPHVIFRPSDAELVRIFQRAAAFYSPATTPRHSLYSPLEAQVIGVPLVFHEGSLFSRLSPTVTRGRVSSTDQANALLREIIDYDRDEVASFIADQSALVDPFTYEACLAVWRENFLPLMPAVDAKMPALSTRTRRLPRTITSALKRRFSVLFHPNRTIVANTWKSRADMAASIHQFRQAQATTSSAKEGVFEQDVLEDGKVEQGVFDSQVDLDFSTDLPWWIDAVEGFGLPEEFGRWTTDVVARLSLVAPLPRKVHLTLVAHAYSASIGHTIEMRIGKRTIDLTFTDAAVHTFTVTCKPGAEQFEVSWHIPQPTAPPNDDRKLGIAIHSLSIQRVT